MFVWGWREESKFGYIEEGKEKSRNIEWEKIRGRCGDMIDHK